MTLYAPLYQQLDSYSANLDRQLLDFHTKAHALRGALGDLAVTQRGLGANMSVDVAAGKVSVPGTDTTSQGSYLCWSDAVVNVAIAASPPAGQSRIDLIVAQVRDSSVIGGGNNDWTIAAITGVAAATGTQVAPATPNSAVVLAQIAVGPTVATIVNANITDKRPAAKFFPHNPYYCRYHRAASWTTTGGGTIIFDTQDSDEAGMYNAATGVFTAPVAGRYRFTSVLYFSSSAAGQTMQPQLQRSGSVASAGTNNYSSGAGQSPVSMLSDELILNAGDQVTSTYSCNTSGLAGGNNLFSTYLQIELLSLT